VSRIAGLSSVSLFFKMSKTIRAADYKLNEKTATFQNVITGRFLSNKDAASIGLIAPAETSTPPPVPSTPAPALSAPASMEAKPDSDIFGNLPPPPAPSPAATPPPGATTGTPPPAATPPPGATTGTPPPAPDPGATTGANFPPENDDTSETEPMTETDHRVLASAIWDSCVFLMSQIIGKFWLPRPVGKNAAAGELHYDEREQVIVAFCVYFKSIGMAVLSPVQNLWLAISSYSVPRLGETIAVIKFKYFTKRINTPPAPVAGDARFTETTDPKTSPASPASQPETRPTPPAPPGSPPIVKNTPPPIMVATPPHKLNAETQAAILRG
jgi:hypothetical protein